MWDISPEVKIAMKMMASIEIQNRLSKDRAQNCQHLCLASLQSQKHSQRVQKDFELKYIKCVHSLAYDTCFSTRPESGLQIPDSPRNEMIGGRIAEPNVFPWYAIISQTIDIV